MIWQSNALWNVHCGKYSYYLPPYRIITKLLTITHVVLFINMTCLWISISYIHPFSSPRVKVYWFSKTNVMIAHFPHASFQSQGCAVLGRIPSLLREDLSACDILSTCGLLHQRFGSVSAPFTLLSVAFSFCPLLWKSCSAYLSSRLLSEWEVFLVYTWEELSSISSYYAIIPAVFFYCCLFRTFLD